MPARRLLYLDASRLTAYRWRPGTPHEEASFSADESGLSAFGEYLQQQRPSVFYLLVDVADEGFQLESVPYVQGRDRQGLINRKLAQYYYGTPLTMAISLGRAKEGRRDEKMLFAGLTGYTHIEPWLQVMREEETQLAGVYSMPQVLAGLVAKLAGNNGQMLVMSITRAGLRQSFFDQGQLRFSRLTAMATGRIEEVATACAAEANKIYQYLAGQRLVARDKPLQTLVLAHPAQFGIIGDRCRNTTERQVLLGDLVAEAKKHGLAKAPTDSKGDNLFLHLLAKRPPSQQFAPTAERRYYRLWQARFAINVAAAGLFGLCLLFAGNHMANFTTLTEGNRTLQTDIDLGERRYQDMMQGLPPVAIGQDNLRALTDRYESLARRSSGPEPLLQHISRALGHAPKVELTQLDWRIAGHPGEDRASAAGKTSAAPSPAATGNGYAIVQLQAQLPLAMASDHRSQLETVNAFAAALVGNGIQVQVLSLPFETESGKSIKSSEVSSQVEPPKFVLRMVQAL
ncbi:MAG TPA: hypothetical protein VFF82_07160 [Rhodocyclaceae bacterium]|nr:hypothetical protein [Rhodocyclaceae bacterium]